MHSSSTTEFTKILWLGLERKKYWSYFINLVIHSQPQIEVGSRFLIRFFWKICYCIRPGSDVRVGSDIVFRFMILGVQKYTDIANSYICMNTFLHNFNGSSYRLWTWTFLGMLRVFRTPEPPILERFCWRLQRLLAIAYWKLKLHK